MNGTQQTIGHAGSRAAIADDPRPVGVDPNRGKKMAKAKLTAKAVAQICARLIRGDSQTRISREAGAGHSTIRVIIAALQEGGVQLNLTPQSRPDPEKHAKMLHLIETTRLSNRAIALRVGLHLDRVSSTRARYNEDIVRAGGELPVCECGRYLHHPQHCRARSLQSLVARGIPSPFTLPPADQQDIRDRLIRGETTRSVAERYELKRAQIFGFVRSLTDDERRDRDRARRTGAGRTRAAAATKRVKRPAALSPSADPLYARISAAIPRNIDRALRDDMIGEAYLACIEGKLDPEQLPEGIARIKSGVFKAFANPWGAASLDAVREDGRTMIEQIPDGTSAFV